MKSKYISTFICGFSAAVLTIVPGLKEVGCCLIIPFAAAMSLFLYQKSDKTLERISTSQALIFGLITGMFAAIFSSVFEIIFTAIFKTNDFVRSLTQLEIAFRSFISNELIDEVFQIYKRMAEDIKAKGFSFTYSIYYFLATSITSLIFGLIGGLLGMAFLNRRSKMDLKQ